MGRSGINWRKHLKQVIAGEPSEFIPTACRLDKWYKARLYEGNLPAELDGMTIEQMEAHLGFAQSARSGRVFDSVLKPPVERIESRQGDQLITQWRTPAGTVRMVQQLTASDEAAGLAPTIIEHPIKELQDYAVYESVISHTEFVPTYDQYHNYDQQTGDSGFPLVVIGPIPFHDLLIRWVGYEQAYLHLYDQPDVVLKTVAVANDHYRGMWQIVAESPAELVMYGVNFDSQMTSPAVFREHFLPYLSAFNRLMHDSGKKVAFHGDGDMRDLLEIEFPIHMGPGNDHTRRALVRGRHARSRARRRTLRLLGQLRVAHASAAVPCPNRSTRTDTDRLIHSTFDLKDPPPGGTLHEPYDLENEQPMPAYRKMLDEVAAELRSLDVPLDDDA